MIIDVLGGSDRDPTRNQVTQLKAAGGDPIIVNGVSNAVGQMSKRIIERAGSHSVITLLRFHGQLALGIGATAGGREADRNTRLANLLGRILGRRRSGAQRALAALRPYFAPYGRVELHGCQVERGAAGRRLIRSLAATLGVPVSTGVRAHHGGVRKAVEFEGPVRTAYPGGAVRGTSAAGVPGPPLGA
jgi:hypothetical protein